MNWRSQFVDIRRVWGVCLTAATMLLGAADQFLPALQGMIPPVAYAALVIVAAVLPSILDRRHARR